MRNIGYLLTGFYFLSSLACGTAWATGLNEAAVPVADQSEPTFNQAVQDALGIVCVKLTGNTEILSGKTVQTLLSRAPQYLASYRYQSSGDPLHPWLLAVEFDSDVLKKAFSDAGISVWSMARPVVLVWVVNQSALISGISNPQMNSVRAEALRLSVPVVFPAGDLDDTLMQGPGVAVMSDDQLRLAMRRYGADAVLAGQVQPDGHAVKWRLVSNEKGLDDQAWRTSEADLTQAFANGFDQAILKASRFAVHSQMASENGRVAAVTLRITGIDALADYAQVMSIVQGLPGVKGVVIEGSAGDELALSVSIRGGREALLKDLQSVASLTRQTEEVSDEGDVLAVVAESPLRYRYGDGTIASEYPSHAEAESAEAPQQGSDFEQETVTTD